MSDVDSTPVCCTGKGKREKPAKPTRLALVSPRFWTVGEEIWGRMHTSPLGKPEKAMELWLHQKDDLLRVEHLAHLTPML